jgi:hypothetical protein
MISLLAFSPFTLLAQAEQETDAFSAIEYDLPEESTTWLIYIAVAVVILAASIYVYIRDTADLGWFWKGWLMLLRIGVLAGLVIIAINPQERTQKLAYRPSQVAIVIDRSLSMRFPESQPVGQKISADPNVDPGASGKGLTRAEAVKKLLAESNLIEELRKDHNVNIFTFDTQLYGPHKTLPTTSSRAARLQSTVGTADKEDDKKTEAPDWDELTRPVGLETRLGESLVDLIRKTSDRSLSGIVMIGDGGSNAGIDPETAVELARTTKTRIITVGTGSTEQPVNLQLASIQAPTDVHIEDPFEISAYVQAQGFTGRRANVQLLSRPENSKANPSVIKTEEVIFSEDGVPVKVVFEQLPTEAGVFEYFVRTSPSQATVELSDQDNERRKTINVVDRKTKVLIIAGGPMRDYRFVRNMLFRHIAIDTDVWLQTAKETDAISQEANKLLFSFPDTKEDLFEYDAIIAFDPNWADLDDEDVKLLFEWVEDQAGGLILVAGDVFLPEIAGSADNTPRLKEILKLYPVVPDAFTVDNTENPVTQPWPWEFTRAGREAGFLQVTDDAITSAEVWREFTGVYSAYPTLGEKAASTVYSYFSDPRALAGNTKPVLLASQYYGAGRTLYLGSPEMWRLRTIDEDHYDRFWTKSIREVSQARLKRGNNRGSIILERTQYVLGQTVRVRAQVLDAQFNPLEADHIMAEVIDGDGQPMSPLLRLDVDTTRIGQFVGNFRAGVPGTWRVEFELPQSRERIVQKLDVVLPNLETDNARQNAQLLRQLAEDTGTGGAYFRLDEAAVEIPKRLPNVGEEFQIDQQLKTLWDREWVMYILVGLLSIEWLTRKLLKLA